MKPRFHYPLLTLSIALSLAALPATAVAKGPAKPSEATLNGAGQTLQSQYAAQLDALLKEITPQLPEASPQKLAELTKARENLKQAQKAADEAAKAFGAIGRGKALVAHAKGKWIGGAEKGIATAQAAIKNAKTDAERATAEKQLASWEANKQDGLNALKERQAALDAVLVNEPALKKANEAAQEALENAKQAETQAAQSLMADLSSFLSSDKLDAKLAKAVILTAATPNGLAAFAQEGPEKAKLVDQLLASPTLMLDMLFNGGANYGKYGRAAEIYSAIQKASPKAASGNLQRLAMATSLEHATPIAQSAAKNATNAPTEVDPVKRYLHYEKAFLDGELDPAFANFGTWEYRHVVNCDAPDEILAWGRHMLRNYRPDHISNTNYGWRYVSAVRTEVPYGSENVQYDDPAMHQYQNIIRNGGVCGRRAFFGRFILRSFGIPTWGVTQKAHAALSHWTPGGWVVNLGAGYAHSWWDKGDVPLSGNQFLLDTQARAHGKEYLKVLRAQWISRILGEPAYNERKNIEGGFWSRTALYQARMLAATAATLGPLGQDLAEANEKEQKLESGAMNTAEQKISIQADGSILIPAVALTEQSGKSSAMKSYLGGMQLHALGGFKGQYEVTAPKAGKYRLSARLATCQTGQKFQIGANGSAVIENDVPYTVGMWKESDGVEVTLNEGKNVIDFGIKEGSRGVTIKDLTLKPAK